MTTCSPHPKQRLQATREADETELSPYFRDLARRDVMKGSEGELATTVERAELTHWVAVLRYLPAAVVILPQLRRSILRDQDRDNPVDLSALPELLELAERAKRHRGALTHEQDQAWLHTSLRLASAIRLHDSDRAWMTEATATGQTLHRVPCPDGPRQLELPLMVSPESPAYRRYLATVRRTDRVQKAARNAFVAANLRLVVKIAKRYKAGRMGALDIIQEGNLGLIRAAERYDRTMGFCFSTYASWWIRHTITRAIADKGKTVRLPVHMTEAQAKVNKATEKLLWSLRRTPTVEELVAETKLSTSKVEAVLLGHAELSLDAPMGNYDDGDGMTMLDTMADEEADHPLDRMERQALSEMLNRHLAAMSPIEARILRLRHGLPDLDGALNDEHTLDAIGKQYSLSRERIRQLESNAMLKLKASVDERWRPD